MQHFLWGFSVTKIARERNVTKPYVSRVVNKWKCLWDWDNMYCEQIRITLLVDNYYKLGDEVIERNRKMERDLRNKLGIKDRYHALRKDEDKVNELLIEELKNQPSFYDLLKIRPETKCYFHNLTPDNTPDLSLGHTTPLYAYKPP
jgi:hypothetical protein